MRAVLVDNHPMFRMGLRMRLRSIEDIDSSGKQRMARRPCASVRTYIRMRSSWTCGCPDERVSPRRCGFIATYDAMSCTPQLK
jgi:hypothetical protein